MEEIKGIRLNKYLSESGVCSRREADRLIEEGQVLLNGKAAAPGSRVLPGMHVLVNGKEIAPEKESIWLAVNKPAGVVCTTDHRFGDRTLEDLVNYPKRVFSVGRLDKDSQGLILMTNCGDLVNKMMKAGNFHEKEYLVTVDRQVTKEFLKKMSAGVYLEELNVTTRPCKISLAGENRFRIILTQGLNRQIRRMCESLGYHVVKLVRLRVMNIELGDLKTGAWRRLSGKEIREMMQLLHSSENNPEHHYKK